MMWRWPAPARLVGLMKVPPPLMLWQGLMSTSHRVFSWCHAFCCARVCGRIFLESNCNLMHKVWSHIHINKSLCVGCMGNWDSLKNMRHCELFVMYLSIMNKDVFYPQRWTGLCTITTLCNGILFTLEFLSEQRDCCCTLNSCVCPQHSPVSSTARHLQPNRAWAHRQRQEQPGPGSPCERVPEVSGRFLFLHTDICSLTMFHIEMAQSKISSRSQVCLVDFLPHS